jgi:membrane protein implicated in regulation of membrane protease activity
MSKTIMPLPLAFLLGLLLLTMASPALAYIGPGAGISVLGSLLGILATIFVAIGAILFWPLRKLLKRRKTRRDSLASMDSADQSDADANAVEASDADKRADG